jgi:hypothetical protein
MRRAWLVSTVLLPLLLAGSVKSGEQVKVANAEVCGVGILSPSGKVLFLPSVSGGVEAVALFNGKTLWESKDASRLLLATGDRVFAMALVKGNRNQVKVVVLDAVTGERLVESAPITFPGWASVTPDYGLSFRCGARLDKADVVLVWEARAFTDGGPPLPEFGPDGKPYVDPNAKKAGGALIVNIATGKVRAVKGYSPKEAEFFDDRPSWVGQTKRQGWVFQVEETGPKSGLPYALTQRTFKAATADGQRSWKREIAGGVSLPPRP